VTGPTERVAVRTAIQLEAYGVFAHQPRRTLTRHVVWHSETPSIVAVDRAGVARMLKAGRAVVVALAEGQRAPISFEVVDPVMDRLDIVTAAPGPLPLGASSTFAARATFVDGTDRDVTTEARWVVEGGVVDGREPKRVTFTAEGHAVVTARLDAFEAKRTIHITPPEPAHLSIVGFDGPMKPGTAQRFRVITTLTTGVVRDVTLRASIRSLNTDVADVHGDALIAIAPGRTSLVASYEKVTTSVHAIVDSRQVVRLSAMTPSVQVPRGRSVRLQTTAEFDDASSLDVTTSASWRSEDSNVAAFSSEVLEEGVLLARAQGTTKVWASFGSKTVAFVVEVSEAALESIDLSMAQEVVLTLGQEATLALYGRYSDTAVVNVTPRATLRAPPLVELSASSDYARIVALAEGRDVAEFEFGGLVQSMRVRVTRASIDTLVVSRPMSERGKPLDALRAVATYSDGVRADVTELCRWTSSDPKVVVGTLPGERGRLLQLQGLSTISASLNGVTGSFLLRP
jgi:hypothetical protein